MTTKAEIDAFVSSESIAVVGASRDRKKFGNTLVSELKRKGYKLLLVHRDLDSIAGEPCVRSLTELQGKVDAAVFNVKPEMVEGLLREAAQARISRVWLQQGSESNSAILLGKTLGINVIAGHCLLMFAKPSGPHAVHRFLVRLLGRLPQ